MYFRVCLLYTSSPHRHRSQCHIRRPVLDRHVENPPTSPSATLPAPPLSQHSSLTTPPPHHTHTPHTRHVTLATTEHAQLPQTTQSRQQHIHSMFAPTITSPHTHILHPLHGWTQTPNNHNSFYPTRLDTYPSMARTGMSLSLLVEWITPEVLIGLGH